MQPLKNDRENANKSGSLRMLSSLKMLNIKDRLELNCAVLVVKCLNNLVPDASILEMPKNQKFLG